MQRQLNRLRFQDPDTLRLAGRLATATADPVVETAKETARFGSRMWRGLRRDKLFMVVWLVVSTALLLGWVGLGLVKASLLQVAIL